jgi:hypothetical protein
MPFLTSRSYRNAFFGTAVSLAVAHGGHAQGASEDSLPRTRCRQIATEIRRSGLTDRTAAEIQDCRHDVGEPIAALWRHPPSDRTGLSNLLTASTGDLDPRILTAALDASYNLRLPPNVRVAATIVMGRYVTGNLIGTFRREEVDGVEWWPYPTMPLSGSRGNSKEFAAQATEVIAAIDRVAKNDPSEQARGLADLVLRFINGK